MSASEHHHSNKISMGAVIGCLGIVFGDIGTSPLYAFKESLRTVDSSNVNEIFGILSLITWSIIWIVSFKYVTLITRADNQGEGGISALLALLQGKVKGPVVRLRPALLLCLFGMALLYGDATITPAISVLSAVEGIKVAAHGLEAYVVPITLVILIILFLIQSHGTARIGALFGPIMLLWFTILGAVGLWSIFKQPAVLAALNPLYGLEFLIHHGYQSLPTMGAVFLAVTGAEALYADMGHFGRKTIVCSWHGIVFPGLLFNYLGQGALVLRDPTTIENPFFHLVPAGAATLALVILSTCATIIASQALISGVFSMTQQAIQLGYFPRIMVRHTSASVMGQIYVPAINTLLGVACVGMVLFFQSSEKLVAAYGVAVSGTMVITTIAFALVARSLWKYSLWVTLVGGVILFTADALFIGSCLHKFIDGGYVPILLAIAVFTVMYTWKIGRGKMGQVFLEQSIPLELFVADIYQTQPHRVNAIAVFMTGRPEGTPSILLHFFKHTQVLYRQMVLLNIATDPVPTIRSAQDRVEVDDMGEGVWRAIVHYGFMEDPNAQEALRLVAAQTDGQLDLEGKRVSYIFNREVILPQGKSGLWYWQKRLLHFLCQIARPARDYFKIPVNQIVEIATPIHL